MKHGGEEVTTAIRQAIKENHLEDYIHTTRTRCNGRCKDACTVIVYPEGTWYSGVTEEEAGPLVQAVSRRQVLAHKIGHTFTEAGFERHNDVEVGRLKSAKKKEQAGTTN